MILLHICCSGVERGFKGKSHPRLVKMVLSATLTQDPSKLAQLNLHHPLLMKTGKRRYQLPEKLESYKLVCYYNPCKTLKAFREGKVQVLVSSDAMTRGMDVEGVRNVINYDMPAYIKTYIHRAGRTARAGQAGHCFPLLHKHEVKRFKMLQKAGNDSVPRYSVPSSSFESLHAVYNSDKLDIQDSTQITFFKTLVWCMEAGMNIFTPKPDTRTIYTQI
ncbi:hypothetical protein CRYUN_Cryun34aG0049900 [Craigia yunnanensis]